MKTLTKELEKDKTEGSYYYAWQSNIAVTIMDELGASHEEANRTAKRFLDLLVG